ncbi:hypothetical protein BH09MYX1_BH09MYX1_50350 [soil metagenome]
MNQAMCPRCHGPLDPTRATYDKFGNLLCQFCAAQNTIAEGESRAAGSLISSAFGVLGAGALAVMCINPLWITSVIAVASGIAWLSSIGRLPEYRKRLGTMYGVCVAVVIVGMVLGLAPIGLFVAATVLGAAGR